MARPDNPTIETTEATLADTSEALAALGDLARLWGELDSDAAMALLLVAFAAIKRIKTRTRLAREAASATYHNGTNEAAQRVKR